MVPGPVCGIAVTQPQLEFKGAEELTGVVKYDNILFKNPDGGDPQNAAYLMAEGSSTGVRDVSRGREDGLPTALTIAAEGGKADIAKPLHGIGSGVLEIALPYRGDAFRVVYALQLGQDIWVIHAFQKKSTMGSKTPKREIDLVRERLRRLQEILK